MHLYSRNSLLPNSVLNEVNYKMTYEALKTEDYEKLNILMITTVVREQLKGFYAGLFDKLASNHEKKFAIRAFIYLDCLVAFYRLPTHIESTSEELA